VEGKGREGKKGGERGKIEGQPKKMNHILVADVSCSHWFVSIT
jgi:hypothetical protein